MELDLNGMGWTRGLVKSKDCEDKKESSSTNFRFLLGTVWRYEIKSIGHTVTN